MKLIKPLLLVAGLFFCLFGQPTFAKDNAQDIIAQKVTALTKAMVDADGKSLAALSSPQLSYGHSNGHVENQAEFVATIADGKSDFVAINLSEQSITIAGDTALVRHILNADTNDGGVPNTIKLGILQVWKKQGGDWKLLARQAVKLAPH